MAIDPTGGNGVHAYDLTRSTAGKTRDAKATHATDDSAAARSTGDTVQLSAASRGLVDASGDVGATRDAGSTGGLSTERLHATLQRLQTGFYDRPQVRDTIATRASADLNAE